MTDVSTNTPGTSLDELAQLIQEIVAGYPTFRSLRAAADSDTPAILRRLLTALVPIDDVIEINHSHLRGAVRVGAMIVRLAYRTDVREECEDQ